jgi:hypothetical protein
VICVHVALLARFVDFQVVAKMGHFHTLCNHSKNCPSTSSLLLELMILNCAISGVICEPRIIDRGGMAILGLDHEIEREVD